MKALLIYKTHATRWEEIKEVKPHYSEAEHTPLSVASSDHKMPQASTVTSRQRIFMLINEPRRDGFAVMKEI